jgi:hypothetical protein
MMPHQLLVIQDKLHLIAPPSGGACFIYTILSPEHNEGGVIDFEQLASLRIPKALRKKCLARFAMEKDVWTLCHNITKPSAPRPPSLDTATDGYRVETYRRIWEPTGDVKASEFHGVWTTSGYEMGGATLDELENGTVDDYFNARCKNLTFCFPSNICFRIYHQPLENRKGIGGLSDHGVKIDRCEPRFRNENGREEVEFPWKDSATTRALVKRDGNKMTLCWSTAKDAEAPRSFDTKGRDDLVVYRLKRTTID